MPKDLTVQKRFKIWPAQFNTFTMNNLLSVDPDSAVEVAVETAGGDVVSSFSHVESNSPTVGLQSRDVHEVLGVASPTNSTNGLVCTSARIQYPRRGATGAENVTLTSTKGFLYVNDFGASQSAKADINCTYAALQNGVNEPLVINVAQTLNATPVINSSFSLGAVKFEGVRLRGVSAWRLRTGIQYTTKADSGDISPDEGTVDQMSYVLEVDCDQLEVAHSASFPKAAPMSTGVIAYLKQYKQGTTHWLDSDAKHIAVSHTAGTYYTQSLSVQNEGDASTRLICQFDGTPSILTGQTIVI